MIVKINGEISKGGRNLVLPTNGCEVHDELHKINSKLQKPMKRLDWRHKGVFGIVAPTLTSLLHFSPEMQLAYTVVCGTGILLVTVGLVENALISSGNTRTAETIERITKLLLTIATTLGISYFLFNMPQWNWG